MSLDVSEIVIQTLEEEVASLKDRGATFAKEISEHKGAETICKAMAESVLGYGDLIERRLHKELLEEKINEREAQIVRVYSKNLIVRLHNVCKSNEESQFNEGFVARGRLTETGAQSEILVKKIANRRAQALGQKERAEAREVEEREAEADTEKRFDSSDVVATPIPVEGAVLPKEPDPTQGEDGHLGTPLVHKGPAPEPEPEPIPTKIPEVSEETLPNKPSAAQVRADALRRGKKPPGVPAEPAGDKPTPQEKPDRRDIHKGRHNKGGRK